MANEVVKALLVEIDGNVEKLRRAVRQGESELSGFATKAKKTSTEAGAGADAMADKQAGAARAIASVTETIARQGKVSGDAAKQLIAQAANVAFAFGPTGAIAGAIGIATLAIVGMFARTREEVEQTERRAIQAMNKFAEMDANAQAREYQQSFRGTRFAGAVDTVFSDEDLADPEKRAEALRARGSNRLQQDLAALERERARLTALNTMSASGGGKEAGGGVGAAADLAENAQRIRAVSAALAELQQFQKDALSLLQETAKQEAEVREGARKLQAETKGQTEAERERAEALKELARQSEQLAETTERLIAGQFATLAERVAAPFDEAIAQAHKLARAGQDAPGNLELANRLAAARDVAVQTAEALAAAEQSMQRFDQSVVERGAPAESALRSLQTAADALRSVMKGLAEDSEPYLKLLAKLQQIEKELAAAQAKRADAQREVGKASVVSDPPKVDKTDMADYARAVQQAADGALQLMQNIGGAAEGSVQMLRSMVQIGANLPGLSDAFSSIKANKPGQGMSLSQFGALAGSALPILGAMSSLFGDSASDRQRAAELRANTEAIRELTEKASLLAFGASGGSVLSAQSALARLLDPRAFSAQTALDPRGRAKALGIDMRMLDEVAKAYGVTLNDSVESFRQLQRAIADTITRLGEFGDDLESQLRQADAEIALRGVTDPLERLGIRQGAYAGRSAALDRVTAGLDLSTAEGRAAARANALALFEVLKAGGEKLGAGDLGGLTGDELLQALLDLIESLNAVEDVAADAAGSTVGAVSGYTGLSAAEGARIADYNRALVGYAREAQATRLAMLSQLETLAARAMAPVPVPPMSALTADVLGGGVGSAAGGVQIVIAEGAIQQVFHVAGGAAAVRDLAANGLEVAVNDALYRSLRRAQMARGDLRAPGRA